MGPSVGQSPSHAPASDRRTTLPPAAVRRPTYTSDAELTPMDAGQSQVSAATRRWSGPRGASAPPMMTTTTAAASMGNARCKVLLLSLTAGGRACRGALQPDRSNEARTW